MEEQSVDEIAAARLEQLLRAVVRAAGVDAEVAVDVGDTEVRGVLRGDDLGMLIGRAGQTINALQYLAPRIVLNELDATLRVTVDIDGYRERRLQMLLAEADKVASNVARSGRPAELGSLPAIERRAIHEHLRDYPGVETESEGEEPDRVLVVYPARGGRAVREG
jgi:spoIIIJ-associated protein